MSRLSKLWSFSAVLVGLLVLGGVRGQELPRFVPHSPEEIDDLIVALRGKDVEKRRTAAFAAVQFGPLAERATPALVAGLKDKDAKVRRHSAEALGRIGGRATVAVPDLIGLLKDKDPELRKNSAQAISRLVRGGAPKHDTTPLLAALKDKDKETRLYSAAAMLSLGYAGKEPFPVLTAALADEDEEFVASVVVDTIGKVGLPAIPFVKESLKDKRARVRHWGVATMTDIVYAAKKKKQQFPPDAIQSLIVALNDEDPLVVECAIYSLSEVGEPAKQAVPEIIKRLKHPDRAVRAQTASQLKEFGRWSTLAICPLRQALQDADENVRREAEESLRAILWASFPSVP